MKEKRSTEANKVTEIKKERKRRTITEKENNGTKYKNKTKKLKEIEITAKKKSGIKFKDIRKNKK